MTLLCSRLPSLNRYLRSLVSFSLFISIAAAAGERGEASYHQSVLPVLQEYCYDCHSDGVNKGKFAMDEHRSYAELLTDLKFWDHVRQMLVTHVMPPVDKKAPSLAQRDALVKWIDEQAFFFDPQKPDPGHTALRRLNRTEYNNTVRDLLFLDDLKPASEFPPDDTGYGFDNIGAVLSLSPMLMEKYLRAAAQIRNEVMKVQPPERVSLQLAPSGFSRNVKDVAFEDDGLLWFFGNAKSDISFSVPADGTYELNFRMAATPSGPDRAKARFTIDGKPIGESEIAAEWHKNGHKWEKISLEVGLLRGARKLGVAFVNDFTDANAPEGRRDRNMALQKVEVAGPMGLVRPRRSRFLNWLLPTGSLDLPQMVLSGEDFKAGPGESALDTGAILLASAGWVGHPVEVQESGVYQISLKLGALQAGTEPAKFRVRLGEQVIFSGEVTALDQAPQWYHFSTPMERGRNEFRVAFLNDYYDPATKADRNLWLHEVSISGPKTSGQGLDGQDLSPLIKRMAERLFRRDVAEEELQKWRQLAKSSSQQGVDELGALAVVLEGMLVSQDFLFHVRPSPSDHATGTAAFTDEMSLANRLSYFLWSAPPSEAVLDKARKGELRRDLPAVIRQMIADYKSRAMVENFAGQWLQLRDVDGIYRSKRQFPEFQGGVAYAMLRETQLYFDHILRDNRSIMEFIQADYTFANRALSKYYGLQESSFKGNDFKKVSLAGTPRGGLLTQGSILALTSNPTRTNIVRRGKFVLESILGIPPPPVPGNVPPLDEEKVRMDHLTLRQQFEAHREDKSCAGCHALLDPVGFALENYDAAGQWRSIDHQQPVDASGAWVRGQKFNDFAELRHIIATDLKSDFVRCLAEHLLTYALGRGLEYADRPAIAAICAQTAGADFKFQDMIIAVCESVPFQKMRMDEK